MTRAGEVFLHADRMDRLFCLLSGAGSQVLEIRTSGSFSPERIRFVSK